MRPRSVFGPLLLIALGVLFLINNVRPDLRVADLLIQYWPYILITWGALRLIEILIWFARSRPVLGPGITGGEWTLAIAIVILGSGVFFASRHQWRGADFMVRGTEMFGESFDYQIPEQKIGAPAKSFRVVVENLRGNARITGADTQEIKVAGRKTVRAMSQTEADQADKSTPVEILRQGENIVVRTNQERVTGDRRINSDIEITVPRGASVECRGRYGDFDITDLNGDVDINSENAGVRIQNIAGGVRVETRKSDVIRAANVKGNVDLRGRGQDVELESIDGQVNISASYWGDVQFRKLAKPLRWDSGGKSGSNQLEVAKLPGEIRMDLRTFTGNDIVGPVRLSAKSLDAQVGDVTQSLEIAVERGDIELRPSRAPLSKMDVRTKSGNIELAVPTAAKFELKATTNRGEIENDFGGPLKLETASDEEGNSRRKTRTTTLSGSVGQGPSIVLTTERGNVTVRKGTGEASSLPPAPPRPPAPPKGAEPLTVEKN
jgi:DUF4097 and DUF4098 domain-containing protein YvlB